jgi:hypothetical protein
MTPDARIRVRTVTFRADAVEIGVEIRHVCPRRKALHLLVETLEQAHRPRAGRPVRPADQAAAIEARMPFAVEGALGEARPTRRHAPLAGAMNRRRPCRREALRARLVAQLVGGLARHTENGGGARRREAAGEAENEEILLLRRPSVGAGAQGDWREGEEIRIVHPQSMTDTGACRKMVSWDSLGTVT